LFLEVDTHSIDINIHPTKTEIKFDDEHSIYAMLRATIKHSLGQFNIAPVLDFERDKGFDTPYDYSKKQPTAPSIEVDRDFNPFREKAKQGNINFPFKREQTQSWESLYVGLKDGFDSADFGSAGFGSAGFDSAQPPTDRSLSPSTSLGVEMEMEFESEE